MHLYGGICYFLVGVAMHGCLHSDRIAYALLCVYLVNSLPLIKFGRSSSAGRPADSVMWHICVTYFAVESFENYM